MKKILITILSIGVMMLLVTLSFFYYQQKEQTSNKIKIGVTVGALRAIINEIAQDKVQVIDLSEGSIHAHEINILPEKLKELSEAKIIFRIGAGLDDWVLKPSKELNIQVFNLDKYVDLMKEGKTVNPHYWLSLENSKKIAINITKKLSEIDRNNKNFYSANLNKFFDEIKNLKQLSETIKNKKNKKIVITHPGFDYLAKEIGLEIIGYLKTEEGEGINPKEILNLAIKIKENNIKTLFVEKGMIDQAIIQFAKIYNLNIVELDPLEVASSSQTYTSTMKENILKIYNSLQ